MAYRFRDPSPVFENLLGTRSAPGGQWHFYALGTTTPKATYQDYELTTPNTNPVTLDSAGRFPFPVWLDGDYTVELKASDGSSIINPTDLRPEVSPGLAIPDPTGHSGEYLTNDGLTVQWSGVVWNLPDPTGSAGYMLVVNSEGTGYILQPQPTPEELTVNIVVTATRFVFTDTDGNKGQLIRGTGTTSGGIGTKQTSGTVTYANAFSETVIPMITATGGPFANGNDQGGYFADVSVSAQSATGFTVILNTNHGESNSDGNINGNITFGFMAFGPIA
jgi:hypothetical protein